jgi:hypothetical protein
MPSYFGSTALNKLSTGPTGPLRRNTGYMMDIEHDYLVLEKMSEVQLPPNPNEFDMTCRKAAFL